MLKRDDIIKGEYLQDISLSKATDVDNLIGSNPTGEVSYTPNFIDIHEKRKSVKQWIAKNPTNEGKKQK